MFMLISSTTLMTIVAMTLGYFFPFYVYSKSIKVLLSAVYMTVSNINKAKREIILKKQKDINDFALIFFKDIAKKTNDKHVREMIKERYIKKAKENNYFNFKSTKEYIHDYERYNYTFSKMLKANIKVIRKELRENQEIKDYNFLKQYFSLNVDNLLKKVNKRATKDNVDSILNNRDYSLAS